ncbi:MAG: Ig domain-containing protein [Clostridia bacterium]|nr:Ig domain-containing protein [Clostridia bacterium]
MKKLAAALMTLLALLGLTALADGLVLPESAVRIESEAFSGAPASWVYIPEGVTYVAPDAFSDSVATVYGYRDSAGQAYASDTGREFFDVGIYDIEVACPPHVPAGMGFTASVTYESLLDVSAVWELVKDGQTVSSSVSGALTMGQEGEFDLRLTLTNAYARVTKLYPAFVSVMQPALPVSEHAEVALGYEAAIISPDETRQYTLVSSNTKALSVNGTKVKGLKEGVYDVSVTVFEGEYPVSSVIPVEVYPTVTSIDCPAPEFLYPGENCRLVPVALPERARYRDVEITLLSGPAVLGEDGYAEFTGVGTAVFSLSSVDMSVTLEIPVVPYPTALAFEEDSVKVAIGGSIAPYPTVYPEGSRIRLTWHSVNSQVASVDASGRVYGLSLGDSLISCQGEGLTASYTAKARRGYDSLVMSSPFTHLRPGESDTLELQCYPEDAEMQGVTWTSADTSVAVVDQFGRVTAVGPGSSVITARADSGVSAAFTVRVFNYGTVTGISLGHDRIYVEAGQTKPLELTVYPEGEIPVIWTSSAPGTLTVDSEGNITGVKSGTATVTAKMEGNSSVAASVQVNVLSTDVVLTMPRMRTGLSEIEANRAKINAVRNCALNEVDRMHATGKFSASQASGRKQVINNAFDCLDFPWMTLSNQAYWKKANDEGGLKIFRPGVVYYGMPYISGVYEYQRQYNPAKAVRENRFYLSDSGRYYILNQNNLYEGKYVGSDCSSLVAMCYYGTERKWLNTHWFYTDSSFYTLQKTAELRPGDIIVKDYSHVVMFLYYANEEHTQIVMIENGGDAWGTNTVSVNTYPISYYYNRGFIPRRCSGW